MAELSQRQIAEDWLKYAVENWKNELTRLKIHNSGDLFDSFKKKVIDSAEGRLQLEISYKWYGSMVDMGVGRGTNLSQVSENRDEKRLLGKKARKLRRPKRWYSKGPNGIGYQTLRLAELVGLHYTNVAAETVAATIDQNVTIDFN